MVRLPANEESQAEASRITNRLVENDIKLLAGGFLEYHRSTTWPYRGMIDRYLDCREHA